jgi:mannitol-1-phosphate/altronate dehydrogenase
MAHKSYSNVFFKFLMARKIKDAQCLTCWLRYLKGYDEFWKKYEVCDPTVDELKLIVGKYWEVPNKLVHALFQQVKISPGNLKSESGFI